MHGPIARAAGADALIVTILDEVIGEEQSAFVPGRLITDNVLVAYETIHAIKRRKRGNNPCCAINLDMLKAYDRVEWHYLEAMLTRLGFGDRFIRLIMKCVTSVRFTIKVNGELLPFSTLQEGCARDVLSHHISSSYVLKD